MGISTVRGQFMQRCLPKITVALVLASGAACGGGTDVISPPPPPTTGLTLAFLPDAEDASTAAALGWQAGIPGLAVTLTPRDSSRAARAFVTSTDGKVAVSDLVAGDYVLEASRLLSDAERRQLGSGDDANGFATRLSIRVATSGAQQVTVPASRKRSLVISEWAFNGGVTAVAVYNFGGFLELFNNADTTVYMDGVIIAEGMNLPYDYPNFPCSRYHGFTDDPGGIWARFIQQVPGSGHEYPVLPGRTVTIATDAIDHRPFLSGALDLSGADFEFSGTADVDNPAVPNLLDVGPSSHSDGHGLYWPGIAEVVIVASPMDLAPLVRASPDGATFLRLPRDKVVDVLWLRPNFAGSEYAECPRLVGEPFDRAGTDARGTDDVVEATFSVSRRSIQVGTRTVLQHTRSSNADFQRTRRTPGALH